MKMIHEYPKATIHPINQPPPPIQTDGLTRLDDIRARGVVRVGYFSDTLPFAFINGEGNLVGYDIEMAYLLAMDMNVKLELIHIDRRQTTEALKNGSVDLIMSGLAITLDRSVEMGLTSPYLNQTFAFVVKDHRMKDFNTRDKVKQLEKLRIGVPNAPYYIEKVKHYLPHADVIVFETPREFFEQKNKELDAFAYSAEAGSAWSLVYPDFTVAIPYPDVLELPLAYAFEKGDMEFKNYLDTWIDLKKKDKTLSSLYDHWILGKDTKNNEPRWSVIRNVLHWMD